jgi:glycine/serine hydroxymethyltransferase
MQTIGRLIVEAIQQRDDERARTRLAGEAREICDRFPVPGLPQA